MELEQYHRALLGLCFAEQTTAELPTLGPYRQLVRGRFLAMAKVAFKSSFRIAGERVLERAFSRYLAAEPPRSPYIREVIGGFARHASAELERASDVPAYARDVLRFEAAKWEVASLPDDDVPPALAEVDFDGVLALNSTLRVLSLAHTVIDREGVEQEQPTPEAQVVLVYRRPGEDEVRWYRSEGLFAALLTRPGLQEQETPLAALVQQAARAVAVDEAMLHGLANELSVAVERRVVLGSRGP